MKVQRTHEVRGAESGPALDTHAELNAYIEKAHRLRSEATAAWIAAAWRKIASPFDGVAAALARWSEQYRTRAALSRCSDRMLEDIGIAREHIALIAKGLSPAASVAPTVERKLWWHEMDERLDSAIHAYSERRRIARELTAYRDFELDEIGVRRIDIPMIARGQPVPAGAA